MVLKRRTRNLAYLDDFWSYRTQTISSANSGEQVLSTKVDTGHFVPVQSQITDSEGHPFGKHYQGVDQGGPFMTQRRWFEDGRALRDDPQPQYTVNGKTEPSSNLSGHSRFRYFGPIYPCRLNTLMFPAYEYSSSSDLNAWGAKAISLTRPTKSSVDLGVSLAELAREGLPSLIGAGLWEEKLKAHRGIAKENLNYQFGIAPIVSDVKSFAKTFRNAKELISQYERDAGRMVRRRYDFPIVKEVGPIEAVTSLGNPGGAAVPTPAMDGGFAAGFYENVGTRVLLRQKIKTVERWFSGAFTYYLPKPTSLGGLSRHFANLDKLYGIEPDVETLWNLAPWSWAVDWVSNIGDVVGNYSAISSDGLVIRYAYMMEKSTVKYEYTIPQTFLKSGPNVVVGSLVSQTKQRTVASPYGFGLTWDGFSPKQLSILASLGITRGR